MGRIIPYMKWKIKNVWNHQPVQEPGSMEDLHFSTEFLWKIYRLNGLTSANNMLIFLKNTLRCGWNHWFRKVELLIWKICTSLWGNVYPISMVDRLKKWHHQASKTLATLLDKAMYPMLVKHSLLLTINMLSRCIYIYIPSAYLT